LKKTSPSSSSKANKYAAEQFLYLTTRGRKSGLPRQIEIWFTEHAGRFFVIAEYETSQWVQNVRAHADVQVRVAGEEFAGTAHIVDPKTEPELHREVQELSTKKYGWGDGTVVELKGN
jgi:deazaflavin-dependent oxidoreductase (nitroreductase family)